MRNLLPEQLADLAKSGIHEEIIQEAQLRSENAKQVSSTLDTRLPSGVESGLVFRYFTPEGKPLTETVRTATHPYQREVVRAKLFYKLGVEGRKYMGQKGSTNHLYLPPLPGFKEKLLDSSIPLFFIEGEKKLLRFWQEGLNVAAAGISGVWNFRASGGAYSPSRKKTLVDEIFQIPLKNREVVILFDSDAAYGPLNKALMAFSSELAQLGANPTPIALPDDFEMEKGA